MNQIRIYCPSYKRSEIAITHKLFRAHRFTYVVEEAEAKLYEKFGVELLVRPASAKKGCMATVRNFILDNRKSDRIIMVDDDMNRIFCNHKRVRKPLEQEEIWDLVLKGFQMAEDCGSGIWGINCQTDPRFYQQHRPFCFSNVVLGPFLAIRDFSMRFDEALPLKEDYDFFLQHMRAFRKVFRFNMYAYEVNHQTWEGGCAVVRNPQIEAEQFALLQKKWGSQLVKRNWKALDSINPIVKMPL